jgi:hypothetical protein
MPESDAKLHLGEDIRIHIFTVSATQVGVCMTIIGIVRIIIGMKNINILRTISSQWMRLCSFVHVCFPTGRCERATSEGCIKLSVLPMRYSYLVGMAFAAL